MKKLLFLHESSKQPLRMWMKSAEFWGIPCEIVDSATFGQLDLCGYEWVAVIDQQEVSETAAAKLEQYVRDGGRLLISGNMPERLSAVAGGIRVRQLQRRTTHRCLRVAQDQQLGNWKEGQILFFTNTYQCSGKDYEWENPAPVQLEVICESCEMDLIDPDVEQWGNWKTTAAPAMTAIQAGTGQIVYTPLCLGEMEWVVQPRIPTFTEFPYTIPNNGLMIFMKDIFAYMSGSGRFAARPLWPDGAQCVVVLSGDVHDYTGIEGRADREYRDMIDNANILKELGLEGKATFFVTAAIAGKFPGQILEAMSRGYEICPHTHQDTCYSIKKWDYETQKNDIARCISSFRAIAPDIDSYTAGFRTHGYSSNYDTRIALERLGYEYLADLQGWEAPGGYSSDIPEDAVTYVSLPQHARDYRGRALNLLEIPDTVANDHFTYRVMKMDPRQALDFFKKGFDRVYRSGGLYQTCLHPYVSLKEAPGREGTYRALLEYIMSHPNVKFMRMKELSDWWLARETLVQ